MTEDEAKTKWCFAYKEPMGEGTRSGTCIGSHCAAWRWLPLIADTAFAAAIRKAAEDIGDASPGKTKATQHVIANRAAYGLPTMPFDGYCGLAGRP